MSASELKLPPGPKRGKYRHGRMRMSDQAAFMEHLNKEYGDIVYYELPMFKCCAVFDADLIREVLVTQEPSFPLWNPGAQKGANVEHGCLATLSGEEHRWRREVVAAGFAESRLDPYREICAREAKALRARCAPGQVIDIKGQMERCVWDAMVGIILGSDKTLPPDTGKDALKMLKIQLLLNLLPIGVGLHGIVTRWFRRSRRALDTLAEEITQAIRRAEDPAHPGDDLVAHFVRAKEQGLVERTYENDRAIQEEAIILLAAYVDAPTAALCFAIHHLARNPAALERLEREVDETLGDRPPEAADFDALTWTRAVFNETIRLEPPAYVMMPKLTVKDCVIGGYLVPKGTIMHVGMRVLHHKAKYWDRPGEFRPERWLEPSAPERARCPEHAYIPFGSGPHTCQGTDIAARLFIYALAALIQDFRLEPRSESPPKRENLGIGVQGAFRVLARQRSQSASGEARASAA